MAFAVGIGLLFIPTTKAPTVEERSVEAHQVKLEKVVAYLQTKDSPLSHEEVSLLVKQEHANLLIAIMGIESQFCKRQLHYNCFGVGGDSAYRHYNNFSESIVDADALITHWQDKGKWLTVETMDCSYVVPCNPNWVRVVNKILDDIKDF